MQASSVNISMASVTSSSYRPDCNWPWVTGVVSDRAKFKPMSVQLKPEDKLFKLRALIWLQPILFQAPSLFTIKHLHMNRALQCTKPLKLPDGPWLTMTLHMLWSNKLKFRTANSIARTFAGKTSPTLASRTSLLPIRVLCRYQQK